MRLPTLSHQPLRNRKRGFSLIELMIAIMILGLGMVMAATVFPVSLDMTRGTVQIGISQGAGDVALTTLQLRMACRKDLAPDSPVTTYRVGLPDMFARELQYPDAVYSPTGYPTVPNTAKPDNDNLLANLDAYDSSMPVAVPTQLPDPADLKDPMLAGPPKVRVRYYTENTFWDAENAPSGYASSSLTYVIPAQNIAPSLQLFAEAPPFPVPLTQQTPVYRTRISIADRVYPPVDLYDTNGLARPPIDVLTEVSTRRYAWTALHYRNIDDKTGEFRCRVAILYRANLNSYYMKQDLNTWSTNTPTVVPAPFGLDAQSLFPQAWRVVLDKVFDSGVIQCTSDVAKLLPTGSFMILGQGGNPPGRWAKVLRNHWDGVSTAAELQIKAGEFDSGSNVAVWVFPPAIETLTPTVRFQSNPPVIDVIPGSIISG